MVEWGAATAKRRPPTSGLASEERDELADERDPQVARMARRAQIPVAEHEARLAETLEHGRARVKSTEARLEQNDALIRQFKAAARRRQAAIERRVAAAMRDKASPPHEPPAAPTSAEDLHRRITESLLWAASIEEAIARQHDVMAARRPDRAEQYRLVAEQAREEAERARARALRIGVLDERAGHSNEPE